MGYSEDINLRINTDANQSLAAFKAMTASAVGLVAGFMAVGKAAEFVSDSISAAVDYEKTMTSLEAVTKATGRDINQVYEEMSKQIGGLASEASVATGFLKGMTTTLDVQQIADMTQAVKEASIAMGENFNQQLPLIIKAVKQLNPAILDNIGVTVRLDQVNQQIRDGYYGMGTAINEASQQHAIFTEIMKQTAKFTGQEAALLSTAAGQMQVLSAATADAMVAFGNLFLQMGLKELIGAVITPVRSLTDTFIELSDVLTQFKLNVATSMEGYSEVMDDASNSSAAFGGLLGEMAIDALSILNAIGMSFRDDLIKPINDMGLAISGVLADAIVGLLNFDVGEFFDGISDALIRWDRGNRETTKSLVDLSTAAEDITPGLVALMDQVDRMLADAKPSKLVLPVEIEVDDDDGGIADKLLSQLHSNLERENAELKAFWNQIFQTRLDTMSDHDAAVAQAGEELRQRKLGIMLQGIEDKDYETQLLLEAETAYSEQLDELITGRNDQIAQADQDRIDAELERWAFLHDEIGMLFEEFALTLITNTGDLGENMKNAFEEMGQSIVRSLVQTGVKALKTFIVQQALGIVSTGSATAATKAQDAASKALTTTEVGLAAATTATTAATTGLAGSSAAALAAMTAQMVGVKALTQAYIDLAAAQAAASLGVTGPISVAAATATKLQLSALLGFDHPFNDREARKQGDDFGKYFMEGVTGRLRAPGFGTSVTGALEGSLYGGDGGESSSGSTTIHLNFYGPLTDTDFIEQEVGPVIEKISQSKGGRVVIEPQNLTGNIVNAFT